MGPTASSAGRPHECVTPSAKFGPRGVDDAERRPSDTLSLDVDGPRANRQRATLPHQRRKEQSVVRRPSGKTPAGRSTRPVVSNITEGQTSTNNNRRTLENQFTNRPPTAIPTTSQRKPHSSRVERYINEDGKVGVVVSADHGRCWSFNDYWSFSAIEQERLVLDRDIVQAVLNRKYDDAQNIAMAKLYSVQRSRLARGSMVLKVVWVDRGEEFRILKHGEREIVRLKKHDVWIRA